MIITCWKRQVKNKAGDLVWEFNHISDGFNSSQIIPTPVSPEQKQGWAKSKWVMTQAMLVDGRVVSV